MQIQIGSKVIRTGSVKRKTTGRTGIVIGVNPFAVIRRFHIQWLKESDGKPVLSAGKNTGNGIKTWVSQMKIKLI